MRHPKEDLRPTLTNRGWGPANRSTRLRDNSGGQVQAQKRRQIALRTDAQGEPHPKTKNPRAGKPARVQWDENGATLAEGDSSVGDGAPSRVARVRWDVRPDEERKSRDKNRTSDRLREPPTGGTRVRFEFARRAHQRKITPNLGINPAKRRSQEESDGFHEKR